MREPALCRRAALRGAAALLAGAALPAQACEFFTRTLRVVHPYSFATPLERGGARLCMRFDEVLQDDCLLAVRSPVTAAARLSDGGEFRLPIPAGSELELHEGGLHIVLEPLLSSLLIGRIYPLELEFEQAGTLAAKFSIDFLPRT